MRLFIGWSGEKSQKIAKALKDWIPKVTSHITPLVSFEDIPLGQNWRESLLENLETANYSVFCITNEKDANWMCYEAGYLEHSMCCKSPDKKSRIVPILFRKKGIPTPLSSYQGGKFCRDFMWNLMKNMNCLCEELCHSERQNAEERYLSEINLKQAFETHYPELEEVVEEILRESSYALSVQRSFSRTVESISLKTVSVYSGARQVLSQCSQCILGIPMRMFEVMRFANQWLHRKSRNFSITETEPNMTLSSAFERNGCLYYIEGDFRVRVDLLKDITTVGSSLTSDVALHSPTVNPKHAVVMRKGDSYFVRNISSKGSTLVNGELLSKGSEKELQPGAVIVLSGIRMEFMRRLGYAGV